MTCPITADRDEWRSGFVCKECGQPFAAPTPPPTRPALMRDVLPFIRATWREGAPVLLVIPAVVLAGFWSLI